MASINDIYARAPRLLAPKYFLHRGGSSALRACVSCRGRGATTTP